jgi:hypothetical protein
MDYRNQPEWSLSLMPVLRMNSITAIAVSLVLSACLSGCGARTNNLPLPPGAGVPQPDQTPVPNTRTATGYGLSVFVTAPKSTMHPDSIVMLGSTVYIGYQNTGDVKDGSNPSLTNTIIAYDFNGNQKTSYTVPGHNDGLLARKDTNELWAMSNEDGNPELTIINLGSGAQKSYTATVPTTWGGGLDDIRLINGVIYASASNPTAPGTPPPTVVSLTLNPNGTTFDVAPVLAGNAMALDITPSIGGSPNPTYNQMIQLALTDPDSEETSPSGNLVLDSQADGKLVFINNPGTASQTASVLLLTLYNDKDGPVTPVDDTRYVPPAGPQGTTIMLFTDASNTTYRLDSQFFTPGDTYSCAQGQVVKTDLKTGHLTPIAVGVGNSGALADPHGMLFIPF